MKDALVSTAVLAGVATLGDFIWAAFLPRHVAAAGVAHGAALCLAMGALLARPAGRAAAGAAAGVAVGAAAAGLFYALAPILRMGAMLPAWFALWMLLAAALRVLAADRGSWVQAGARGALAGAASGAAFYLVSDMWTRWNPGAINYADHFARWAFAFAPGFLVLQSGRRS